MSENKYKGRILSFWQLLKSKKIEIPIIQRDYAQGRVDKKEIRENFLSALFNSLNDSKPIKLDFIYGSNEDNSFQPLDGQQRLTTLFLLHWYAYQQTNPQSEDNKNVLKKFSYETRISSREFCEALVTNSIILTQNSQKLSETIIDSSWFVLSWKKDPTIDSMLRTIDDIHKKFYSLGNFWDKLTFESCPISFYHVELENMGLTDDLYIKMNARGKLLSPFENFKASFQKYILDNKWAESQNFRETFAGKIDTKWTALFWSHRKENTVDEAFMRFTSAIVMIRLSIEKHEDRVENIRSLQQTPNSVKPELFTESGFNYLCECFDIYSKIKFENINLLLDFPLWQHKPNNNIFSALVYEDNLSSNIQKNSASYTQKVLFYAQTEYLRKVKDFNLSNFHNWMRVVRNIVSRGDIEKSGNRPTIIRSPESFDGVINLINELSEGCENIYEFLVNKETFKSLFAKDQVEEEKQKATLILLSNENKNVIFGTEDNDLLRGRINFAFYCIGYEKNITRFDVNALSKIQKVFANYFNSDESKVSDELRRAFLTIEDNGKYEYYNYWWSFWYVGNANKRCLIDRDGELEFFMLNQNYKLYFKKLVLQLIDNNLNKIISDFTPPPDMPNWKVRLIKEPLLLKDKCASNYFAIPENESCCYLLKSMRPRDFTGCEKIE